MYSTRYSHMFAILTVYIGYASIQITGMEDLQDIFITMGRRPSSYNKLKGILTNIIQEAQQYHLDLP